MPSQEHYFNLAKRVYPAGVVTPATASAFYYAMAKVLERIDQTTDAEKAQALTDTATDIWLRLIADERGVDIPPGASDAAVREAIHKDEDTVTPTGMSAAVQELVDLYATMDYVTPAAEAAASALFEAWLDGGYAFPTVIGTGTAEYSAAFANDYYAAAGPVETATFEFILPGVPGLTGGNFAHKTGTGFSTRSAFAHNTASGDTRSTFTREVDQTGLATVQLIAASIEKWRAAGVAAYAELRQTPQGALQDPFFSQGFTFWNIGLNGGESHNGTDSFIDPLESPRVVYLDASGGEAYVRSQPVTVVAAGRYRVTCSLRTVTADPGVGIIVGLFSVTRGQWWDPGARAWVGGFDGSEFLTDDIPTSRTRVVALPGVDLNAGEQVYVQADVDGGTQVMAVYHLGFYEDL